MHGAEDSVGLVKEGGWGISLRSCSCFLAAFWSGLGHVEQRWQTHTDGDGKTGTISKLHSYIFLRPMGGGCEGWGFFLLPVCTKCTRSASYYGVLGLREMSPRGEHLCRLNPTLSCLSGRTCTGVLLG